jgi:FkbM family methyltransferase
MKKRPEFPTLRSIGVHATHLVPFLESAARRLYSRLPESLHDTPTSWLRKLFSAETSICFIEVGAFDGVAGDPIHSLVSTNPGWRGALIEPQREIFERLRRNYANCLERLHFFNCAVSNARGNITLYGIDDDEIARLDLPPWSREIASVSEAHVVRHFPGVRVTRRCVPCLRIADVVEACRFSKVDLMVLDVEGHERQIIEDIDFVGLGVKALVFEHKHMPQSDQEWVIMRLKMLGFSVRRYGRDALAYRKSLA